MIAPPTNQYAKPVDIHRHAQLQISSLLSIPVDSNKSIERLENLRELLHSLALGTNDFDVANLRIGNAKRYFQSGEAGAARYEIRLLAGGLRAQLETDPGSTSLIQHDRTSGKNNIGAAWFPSSLAHTS